MRRDGFFPPGLLVHRLSQGQIRAVSVSTQFCRSRNGSRRGKARRAYACMAKGFDEAWAHFCPSKPCLPLSIDVRPYLNKYWENRSATKNVVCSSEFFVFDTKNINRIYFMEILSSTIIQEQLTPLYSGARMPRINESDFMGLKIPLPSPQKQQEIVDYISEVRRKIATLQLQIPLHSQRAKKEFEEAVFGEAQKRIY